MTESFFDSVDPKVDFPAMEKKLLESWYKNGIVDKYLSKNKSSKKYFSFLDGPITANNPMGVHHAWGRTYKDLWPRFYSMRGYKQRHQSGFDCQGLWVEVEVEKELGFKNKKDIEKFGVGKFVDLCKARVKKYSGVQTEQSKRLGYFADWDNSYYTLSDDNNYMIWHFLKVCHENGWLYKGKESVPWCPRCQTAISQHEMLTEDYKEVTHKSIILEFKLVDRDKEYLLVWTTTPWTIPANIAVAVDKKINYSLVEGKTGDKYWVASDLATKILGKGTKQVKKTKGSELVGLSYTGPFDDLPIVASTAQKNPDTFHRVIATDDRIMPISTTEGTGLVHTAVSAGTEDFKLGKKLGLPMIPVIEDNADYMEGLGFLTGQNAKKHPELILDYLEKRDNEGFDCVFEISNYKHRYPACWRCKQELVWKVTDEWYISMDKGNPTLRDRLKKITKNINWMPSFGLKRELDWLENMNDWLISKKNRYWGLALPIWECPSCGSFEVIGGKDELKEKAVSGWSKFEGKSPHKPQIDEVKIKCQKCGKIMNRIEPVGNPWLDAGIVSFSTISQNNKACQFEPNDTKPLYLQNKKEWLNWFPADFITESFPGQFKNWFYSLIVMSTVLEDKAPTKNILGFATLLAEDGRPMHKSWGNSIEFSEGADKIGVDVMRWMYVRQNPSENMLFGYKNADETRRRFHLKLWNVYNYFVTYANLDGWKPGKSNQLSIQDTKNILDRWMMVRLNEVVSKVTQSLEKYDAYAASGEIDSFVDDLSLWYIRRSRQRDDKIEFYKTCYFVLLTLSKMLTPFTPYMSDVIFKNLTKKQSVHVADWPDGQKISPEDKKVLADMKIVREIVEVGHSLRKTNSIPVRQPLTSLSTTGKKLSLDFEELVKDELNVKSVNWDSKKNLLDLKITPQLEEEAKTRELARKIQEERKNIGIKLDQKIVVTSEWLPKEPKLVNWLTKKTITKSFKKGGFSVKKV